MQRKNKNETENKRNDSLFIPGGVYAGNVSLLAFYWILIKGIFQRNQPQLEGINGKSANAFYSAIEHGNTKQAKNQEVISCQNGKKEIQNEL